MKLSQLHFFKSFFILIITLLVLLYCSGCGGNSGGGGDNTGAETDDDVSGGSTELWATGYNLSLCDGTYWEYYWSTKTENYSQSSGSSVNIETGNFRLTLSEPVSVNGFTAYQIISTGKTGETSAGSHDYSIRWKYIAVNNNRILASTDGLNFQTIFDAGTGKWEGGGFFTEYDDSFECNAEYGSIDNNYISTDVHCITRSSSEGEGFYLDGLYIPPDDETLSVTETEYYKPGIGPVGYYLYQSYSNNGGAFYTSNKITRNIGLVASSLNASDGFIPSYPAWLPKAEMTNARSNMAAAVINNKIYITGGGSASLEIYDPETDSWSSGNEAPFDASTGCELNGKFYAFSTEGEDTLCVAVYDPLVLKDWTYLEQFTGFTFSFAKSISTGSRILLINCVSPNELLEYFPSTNTAVYLSTSESPSNLRPGVAYIDNYIYVTGNYDTFWLEFTGTTARYNISTNIWEYVSSMSTGCTDLSVASMNNKIYSLGGYKTGGYLNKAEVYDISADKWSDISSMNIARENAAAVVVNSNIYIIGGHNNDGDLKSVEEYNPDREK